MAPIDALVDSVTSWLADPSAVISTNAINLTNLAQTLAPTPRAATSALARADTCSWAAECAETSTNALTINTTVCRAKIAQTRKEVSSASIPVHRDWKEQITAPALTSTNAPKVRPDAHSTKSAKIHSAATLALADEATNRWDQAFHAET